MLSRLFIVFKKFIKWLAICVAALLIAGVLISIFYGKEIRGLVINELNKHLVREIKVSDFNFSVIRHFPYASVEMENIYVRDSMPGKNDTLLYAKRLSLLFNFYQVFSKNVSIKKIILKDGNINIRVDSLGKDNYHIWKKGTDTISTGGAIDIQKILLRDVMLTYRDRKSRQDYLLRAEKADLSGKFGRHEFKLNCDANLFVDHLGIHGINYIHSKPVVIKSAIEVNSATEIYKFPESEVKVADVSFTVDGVVNNSKKDWLLDIKVKAQETKMNAFISILPSEYEKYLSNYKAKGRFVFNAIIKGSVEGKSIPAVDFDFAIHDGTLASKEASAELGNVNVNGTYKNKTSNGKSALIIPALTASFDGHPIKADLRIDDLENAFLTLHASASFDLAKVKPFIKADTLQSLTGNVALNISYSGKVDDLKKNVETYQVDASGSVKLTNVGFSLKNNPLTFKNMNGMFTLKDKDIEIKDFTGNVSSTDFVINGTFKNFVSFLLVPGQSGDMQGSVHSSSVELDELLVNKSSVNSNDTSYIMKFNPRLICEMKVDVKKLNFRKFKATDVTGNVVLRKQIISGHGLSFGAMNGKIVMDAMINASRRDSVLMTYDAKISKLDITSMFYQMENFGQTTLMDKNVKGVISADVQFYSTWSKDLTLNQKSVKSTCVVSIENGELNNFSPIQALAKYIHVPDLNHIRFSTLTNTVSIADRKINIPNMEIKSNAIDISGNGIHDFDNNIDYHFRLLLSDVLGRKMKANSSEFGEIEDDGLGRSKLFISMKGSVVNPKFSLDKKAVGEKVKTDIKNEKQNLKAMLKEEFGLFKKDTVQIKKPQKKKDEMQIDWNSTDDK